MRRTVKILTLAFVIAAVSPVAWAGNINLYFGERSLDNDVWGPVQDQPLFGASFDWEVGAIDLVAAFFFSDENSAVTGGTATLQTGEISFGIQKRWDSTNVRPYIGGGASVIQGDLAGATLPTLFADTDNSVALYLDGGLYFRLGESFNLGLDVRYLTGSDITLVTVDTDVDYLQYSLLVGWGWD